MTGWTRLNSASRLQGLDLARGLAIVGMFAAHLITVPDWSWSEPSSWGAVVSGRSSILFATVAGISLALMTGGTRPQSGEALARSRGRIAIRAFLIWMIGLMLIATGVPVFVILPAYAVLFLLAIPLLSLRAGVLLPLAVVLAIVTPFLFQAINALPLWETDQAFIIEAALGWQYPFVVWITFLVAGLGLGRLDLRSLRVQLILLLSGAAIAVAGYGADAMSLSSSEEGLALAFTAQPHSSGLYEVIGSGGFAIAVAALCLLICRTALTWAVLPLRAMGTMPLSAYTVHLIVWWIWALIALGSPADLWGFRELEPFWPLTIAVLIGATLWAILVGRGPLESVVDRISRTIVR